MEYAYRADTWQALYAAVAGSAAALTGLLFIGLSLNLRIIVKTLEHTACARETFGGLLSLLVLFIHEGTQRYKRHKRHKRHKCYKLHLWLFVCRTQLPSGDPEHLWHFRLGQTA